jgi:O-antigen/teichoic acid export membrane protein
MRLTMDGDLLRTPAAGRLVIRGAAVRGMGYGVGVLLVAAASVFLLRYLGVADFGRFATIMSLIAIVSGVTDAGLTAVGARDLPLRARAEQPRLLANLLGLRLLLTPLGVLGAAAFAIVAGYDDELVLGTLLAGAGLVLINAQATMMLPLQVDLRIGRLTAAEVLRQALTVAGIVVLVAAGASLLPFFAVPIIVGLGVLAASPLLIGPYLVFRPALDRGEWRILVREALPLAASLVMSVIYFRVLIILVSLLSTAHETGLYATSFRVFEILFGLPTLVLTVALPVLAVAHDDRARLRYVLQRMTEVGAIAAVFLAILIVIVARPIIELLGGSEYADAAPILSIQAFALVAVFLGQVWQLGLISIRRQSALVLANGVALALVLALGLALIPVYDAIGAAVAAVVAEVALAATLFVLIAREDSSLRPDLAFVWKPALAGGLMAACLLVPDTPVALTALLGTAVYALAIWLTRALPGEVLDAFRPDRPAHG